MGMRKQYRGVSLISKKEPDTKHRLGTSGLFTRDIIHLGTSTCVYRLVVEHSNNIWRTWPEIKWLIDQVLDNGIYARSYTWAQEIKKTI